MVKGKSEVCKFCSKVLGKVGYDLGFCSHKCFSSWMNGETPKARVDHEK